MIPVLGVPILNRPDLLADMLLSIDVPVGRLVIVDNGNVTDDIAIRPGVNLGVAASWNLVLKATPNARWWALVNFDVDFAPGDLRTLTEHMDRAGGLAMLRNMAAFALTPEVVDRVGWFDENFHPAYCEDMDYLRRCQLADVQVSTLPSRHTHHESSTYRSDHAYELANLRTYPRNVAYYHAKWGGVMGSETFRTPFNRGGHLGDWRLERDRIASLAWTSDAAVPVAAGRRDDGALPGRVGTAIG